MKSKELIRLLQEEDPTGEVEVCIDNADIHFISTEPAYWDGTLQVLTRDHSKDPYYNITGGKYVRTGSKVVLHPLSIRDVLWSDPDAIIDYSEFVQPDAIARSKAADDATRAASLDCSKRVQRDGFYRWVLKTAGKINPVADYYGNELKETAYEFYNDNNMSPNDPLIEVPNASIASREEITWNELFEVKWDGYWEIHKKENGK